MTMKLGKFLGGRTVKVNKPFKYVRFAHRTRADARAA